MAPRGTESVSPAIDRQLVLVADLDDRLERGDHGVVGRHVDGVDLADQALRRGQHVGRAGCRRLDDLDARRTGASCRKSSSRVTELASPGL